MADQERRPGADGYFLHEERVTNIDGVTRISRIDDADAVLTEGLAVPKKPTRPLVHRVAQAVRVSLAHLGKF